MRVLTRLAIAPALAAALVAAAGVRAAPALELSPAWGGWSRPGRTTELAVRVHAERAARAAVAIDSGAQSVSVDLALAAGEARRVDVVLPAGAALDARIDWGDGPVEKRRVALSLSESPLLAAALSDAQPATLPGFHSIVVAATGLPRHAAAYSSIDALLIDHATLTTLDPAQVAALLGHVAGCGRLALVGVPPAVDDLLRGAAGCGARMLVGEPSPAAALEGLAATLAVPTGTAPGVAELAGLAPADSAEWRRLAMTLCGCAALLLLALVLARSTRVLLLVPPLATLAVIGLLAASRPAPRLVVWAEAESDLRIAQYQAWHAQSGRLRGALVMPVLQGLGQPRACQPQRPARIELSGARDLPVQVHQEGRLFDSATLCYSGTFPVRRSVRLERLAGNRLAVRNAGDSAWPTGVLVSEGRALALPALEGGASVVLALDAARPPVDAAQRLALARTPFGGHGLLWPLALDALDDAPDGAAAWLLVPLAGPP